MVKQSKANGKTVRGPVCVEVEHKGLLSFYNHCVCARERREYETVCAFKVVEREKHERERAETERGREADVPSINQGN